MQTQIEHKTILFGLGWSSLSTIINGLTQVLRLAILTRFLEKEDFGIVAILTFIVGVTLTFSDMGFAAAIMSQKDLKRQEFLNLYWTQFILFTLAFVVISCLAYPIANFYKTPALSILIPVILLELPLLGIGKLYDTVLQKNLLFKIIHLVNHLIDGFHDILQIIQNFVHLTNRTCDVLVKLINLITEVNRDAE